MNERMTNTELANLLGLSHVQVSRLRSGARTPGVTTMGDIQDVLGWSATDQIRARRDGVYASEFEAAIERYASGRETEKGPTD